MHLSKSKFVVVSGLFVQAVFSNPVRRGNDAIADLQLLGAEADCFDFGLDGSLFSATCVSAEGIPTLSSIDLDRCVANDNGNMVHRLEGGAFRTCSDCALNGDTLDLTCTDCPMIGQGFQKSTLNLDGTARVGGDGVFVRDNGKVGCRAPGKT